MFGLGMPELLIILVIVVVVFGASRLPLIGDGMGKMITNFKQSMKKEEPPQTPEAEPTPPHLADKSEEKA